MLRKKITMTIPEFCKLQRGEISIQDIKMARKMELMANRIMKDDNKRRFVTFLIACGLMIKDGLIAYAVDPSSKIDVAGRTILGIVRRFGYWICIIMCVAEIIKSLGQGDTKGIGKIVLKYLLAFAAFYMVPWLFDLIKELFG